MVMYHILYQDFIKCIFGRSALQRSIRFCTTIVPCAYAQVHMPLFKWLFTNYFSRFSCNKVICSMSSDFILFLIHGRLSIYSIKEQYILKSKYFLEKFKITCIKHVYQHLKDSSLWDIPLIITWRCFLGRQYNPQNQMPKL